MSGGERPSEKSQGLSFAQQFWDEFVTYVDIEPGQSWRLGTEISVAQLQTENGHGLSIVNAATEAALNARENLTEAGLVGFVAAVAYHLSQHSSYEPIKNRKQADKVALEFVRRRLGGTSSDSLSQMDQEGYHKLFKNFAFERLLSPEFRPLAKKRSNTVSKAASIRTPRERANPAFDVIIEFVAGRYGIPVEELLGNSRQRDGSINPRHVAMYFCRELVPRARFNMVSRYFFKESESTAKDAYNKVVKMMGVNEGFRGQMDQMRTEIQAELKSLKL